MINDMLDMDKEVKIALCTNISEEALMSTLEKFKTFVATAPTVTGPVGDRLGMRILLSAVTTEFDFRSGTYNIIGTGEVVYERRT